ncbi:MAG: hypothetical protein QM820_01945 [Minicystis sp.]
MTASRRARGELDRGRGGGGLGDGPVFEASAAVGASGEIGDELGRRSDSSMVRAVEARAVLHGSPWRERTLTRRTAPARLALEEEHSAGRPKNRRDPRNSIRARVDIPLWAPSVAARRGAMKSFDQSIKYLLQHEPADFIRFGLGDVTVRVLGPVPSVLPARGRDVDGAYVIARGGAEGDAEIPDEDKRVAHIELHRRHQGLAELAVDVAEAQIRLYRRERKRVVSHVWDLYGDAGAPAIEERSFWYGDRSRCVYLRINLRGLTADELLAQAPAALWPLAALTRDGAQEATIEKARDAIEGHTGWGSEEKADHLAVLSFVAAAEGMPDDLIREYLSRERLMESTWYQSILDEGEARGEAKSILAVLAARGIAVSDAIRARILGCTDIATLDVWIRRAAVTSTAASVVRATAKSGTKPARPARRQPRTRS